MHPPAAAISPAEPSPDGGPVASSPFEPTRFDHLSEAEILARIGALLASALIRSGRLSRPTPCRTDGPTGASAPIIDLVAAIRDPVARRVAHFLMIAGPATPHELANALGLKRRTLARKLQRLRQRRFCAVTGKTRSACYEFRVDTTRN
jgi:hypothetical protein